MDNESPDQALEYVGFWARTGATLIDTVLLLMVTIPLMLFVYGAGYWNDTALIKGPAGFVIEWLLPIVAILLFWHLAQATPGKMAVSARIVDARTGAAPSMRQWIVRYLGYFVSTVPLCMGFLWVAFDARKQGWHDKLAGTVVVRPKSREARTVEFPERKP